MTWKQHAKPWRPPRVRWVPVGDWAEWVWLPIGSLAMSVTLLAVALVVNTGGTLWAMMQIVLWLGGLFLLALAGMVPVFLLMLADPGYRADLRAWWHQRPRFGR